MLLLEMQLVKDMDECFLIPKSNKLKGSKNNQDDGIFKDTVSKVQFYYMDDFVLSSTSNELKIFKFLRKPDNDKIPSFQLAKTFKLPCRSILDFTSPNHYRSFLVLCSCSDHQLRVLDLNNMTVSSCRSEGSRSAHRVVQSTCDDIHQVSPDLYNLHACVSVGECAKLWDLRRPGSPIQRYGQPSGRHACGIALSSDLRRLSLGSEDGWTYVYDMRKTGSYIQRLGGEGLAVTDTTFTSSNLARNHAKTQDSIISVSLSAHMFCYSSF